MPTSMILYDGGFLEAVSLVVVLPEQQRRRAYAAASPEASSKVIARKRFSQLTLRHQPTARGPRTVDTVMNRCAQHMPDVTSVPKSSAADVNNVRVK